MSKSGKLRSKGLKQFFGAATPLTGGGGWREKEIWLKNQSLFLLWSYVFSEKVLDLLALGLESHFLY